MLSELEGGYRAFYNPGGPGPEPFEGIRYTEPGPADLEPVIIAILQSPQDALVAWSD